MAVGHSSGQLDGLRNRLQVQYLHLTVKEFLEKPDVWSALLHRTCGTGFHASVALLRSCILVLKCTRLAWDDHISSQIEPALRYALVAENSTGQAQIDLLDELAQFMYPAGHKNRDVPWPFAAGHECGGDFENRPTHFLRHAVAKGLTLYVQSKAGQSLPSLNAGSVRPLLLYARDCANLINDRYDGDNVAQENSADVQPSMVAMLLQGNLSPNQPFNNSTPWIDLLAVLVCKTRAGFRLPTVWMDVCRLFLFYGADPKGDSWKFEISFSVPGLRNNISHVLNAVFSHLANTHAFRQLLELQEERCRNPYLPETKQTEYSRTDESANSTNTCVTALRAQRLDYCKNEQRERRSQKESGPSKTAPKFRYNPMRQAPGYRSRCAYGEVSRMPKNVIGQGRSGVQEVRMRASTASGRPKAQYGPRQLDTWADRRFGAPPSSRSHRHYRVIKPSAY